MSRVVICVTLVGWSGNEIYSFFFYTHFNVNQLETKLRVINLTQLTEKEKIYQGLVPVGFKTQQGINLICDHKVMFIR